MRLRKSGALSGHSHLESGIHFILCTKFNHRTTSYPINVSHSPVQLLEIQVMLNRRNEAWKIETTCQRSLVLMTGVGSRVKVSDFSLLLFWPQ